MNKTSLEPYIFFTGNCREAMEYYKSIFGGELTMQTYGEAPAMPGMPETDKDYIMHSTLKGDEITFMASDSTQTKEFGKSFISLSLSGPDEEKLRGIFEKLADGGSIEMPLEKVFWGDFFGTLTDKYGVEWMINIGTGGIPAA